MNDFRPVTLTPVAMKCLEKLVLQHMNSVVPDTVHRLSRSVDDAVALTSLCPAALGHSQHIHTAAVSGI